MVTTRAKGVANTFVFVELAMVSLCYWLGVFLWELAFEPHPNGLTRLLFYNEFLLLGLLFGSQVNKRSYFDHDRSAIQPARTARRQTFSALFLVFAAALAVGDNQFPREFFFIFGPVLYGLLWLCNTKLPHWLAECFFGPSPPTRVLLVGDPERVPHLRDWLEAKRELGFLPVGFVRDATEDDEEAGGSGGGFDLYFDKAVAVLPQKAARTAPDRTRRFALPMLGNFEDLDAIIEEHRIHQVTALELLRGQHLLRDLTRICERRGARLAVVSDLEQHFRHSVRFFNDDGIQVIGLRDEPLEDPVNRFSKRLLDILISIPVVVFILPVSSLIVWIFQRAQSPGPLLYKQTRAGLQNRPFTIFKYRTMHSNHRQEARQASQGDDRIYPAGRWFRKFSVDELPQFLNVLSGEMSVVGPRPHLTAHNAAFAEAMNNYHVRTIVKPGLTGLAQVSGLRGETKTEMDIIRRVSADIEYLENWSLLMDLVIVVRTIKHIVLPPPNAY